MVPKFIHSRSNHRLIHQRHAPPPPPSPDAAAVGHSRAEVPVLAKLSATGRKRTRKVNGKTSDTKCQPTGIRDTLTLHKI